MINNPEETRDALAKLEFIDKALGKHLMVCPFCYKDDRMIVGVLYDWYKCNRCDEKFSGEQSRDAFRYMVDKVQEALDETPEAN